MQEELNIWELRQEWSSGRNPALIDVRSVTEYASGHISGAVSVPLPELEARRDDIRGEDLIFICERGVRAHMARKALLPCFPHARVLSGGMHAWRKASFPIVRVSRSSWSLERQVRLIAGLIMLAGIVLGLTISPAWLAVSVIPAVGLIFAGLTDICPLGLLLGRMPWNQVCRTRTQITDSKESFAK